MTDNNHQILQDVRKGKTQPTTADWYTLTGMFERTRMRHIINSMPNEATARAVAEAISTQWHQLVKDMGYTEMWEVELVLRQNGSEAWHCALTPPLSEYNNIVYEHIEDVLHTYITEFFTTNNRQGEEPSAAPTTATTPTPPAEPQHKKPSGRKQNEIDKPEKMEAKAKELETKWKKEKRDQRMVITETGVDNEVNQFIIDFMADWASERIFLQKSKTAPAPAVRFLRDYCKIPIEGIEWRTWQTHTAKMIPQIYEEKKRKKE